MKELRFRFALEDSEKVGKRADELAEKAEQLVRSSSTPPR